MNITRNRIKIGTTVEIIQKQDQHTETLKLESTSIENLINQTYQDLLIKFAQNIGQ